MGSGTIKLCLIILAVPVYLLSVYNYYLVLNLIHATETIWTIWWITWPLLLISTTIGTLVTKKFDES